MDTNRGPQTGDSDLSTLGKAALLWRVWRTAAAVQLELRRRSLPEAALALGTPTGARPRTPALLSRAVSRGLRIGWWRPRCLTRSLVLYRMLREQGEPAELVIGLPDRATSPDAHAWVELGGRDVGPWPGRGVHQELTRYPIADRAT